MTPTVCEPGLTLEPSLLMEAGVFPLFSLPVSHCRSGDLRTRTGLAEPGSSEGPPRPRQLGCLLDLNYGLYGEANAFSKRADHPPVF